MMQLEGQSSKNKLESDLWPISPKHRMAVDCGNSSYITVLKNYTANPPPTAELVTAGAN